LKESNNPRIRKEIRLFGPRKQGKAWLKESYLKRRDRLMVTGLQAEGKGWFSEKKTAASI